MLTETPLGGATATPDRKVIGERIQKGQVGMGLALVSGLLRALLDLGIEPEVNTPAINFLQTVAMSRVFKLKKMENMSRYKLSKA